MIILLCCFFFQHIEIPVDSDSDDDGYEDMTSQIRKQREELEREMERKQRELEMIRKERQKEEEQVEVSDLR